ncbi:glycosyltransferase [uncultured Fusobacterium sp.]|uniref:glycosyltransferase n=1 Tax=uncultured Fusobacterium sp. TaxID=159267 RepID=UPI0025EAE4BE|nr:glycosyltransferase [uncultured Fusobacterium sp.]
MKKKRVLFYNGQLFMGGIERVLTSYLQGLANDEDLEITVLIKENDPEKNIFLTDIPKNLPVVFIKTEEMVKFRNKVKENKKNIFCRLLYPLLLSYERIYMKKWLKRFMCENQDKFDVVIDFDMSLGKYLDIIDLPKIGWMHLTSKNRNEKKKKRLAKRLNKYWKIVVICDEMKEEVKSIFRIPEEKIIRLYNPFDIDRVKKGKEIIKEEDKNYLKKDYIVAVSRLVKEKGRIDLVEIYNKLYKDGVQEKLYILGEGPAREELEKRIKELKLEDKIILVGQKKNPLPWIKNAKIFVHTSYSEGLPTVFLESMILGTPVITYDCPTGPKDILGDNKYGVLVKTGDKESFKIELEKLLIDEERRKKYIEDFYIEKLQEFNASYVLKQFKKILNFGDERNEKIFNKTNRK